MNSPLAFDEIKKAQHAVWSSGSYGKIAWLTVPLADPLCESVDLRSGSTVLDVATGTGHVALAAARRFCDVTGIDYVPALIAEARERAAAEGLDQLAFKEADAEDLPFPDASFDFVLSAIGVMFTADHQRAANELLRVCRPGGKIGLASWTPSGFIGQMLKIVGGHAPPPPSALPPPRWGTEDVIRDMFGPGVDALNFTTATITVRMPSPEFFVDFFIEHYGPTLKAAARVSDAGRQAFRDDLVALASKSNRASDGTFVSNWEYLTTVATRA
jgi:SAM-dependent methyltransferase